MLCAEAGAPVDILATDINPNALERARRARYLEAGDGAGTVTSGPAGIDCGLDCIEAFPIGYVVAMTTVPMAGSTFTGWSGGGCAGSQCVVTIIEDTTIIGSGPTVGTYFVRVQASDNSENNYDLQLKTCQGPVPCP